MSPGEQARIAHEGYRSGLYVRILIKNVPMEFAANFQPSLPVILGGLGAHEMTMGIIRARFVYSLASRTISLRFCQ